MIFYVIHIQGSIKLGSLKMYKKLRNQLYIGRIYSILKKKMYKLKNVCINIAKVFKRQILVSTKIMKSKISK